MASRHILFGLHSVIVGAITYTQASAQILGVQCDELYLSMFPCNPLSDQDVEHLWYPRRPSHPPASPFPQGNLLRDVYLFFD